MKVILIGHACGPNLGSEPGNTWNLSSQLARQHQIWVITHPQRRESIERFMAEHPNPNLQFVYVITKSKLDKWNPDRGEKNFRMHYLLWQHEVARVVGEMCETIKPDVVHHFSLGTIKAPPVLHKIDVPVVWGPMGGGQTMPPKFARYFKGQLIEEYLRIALAKAQPFVPSLRRMCKRAAVILANNLETLDLLRDAGAKHAKLALETAVPLEKIEAFVPERHSDEKLNVLWAGRIETRKALPLALEAIAKTKLPVTMKIAGDGDRRGDCQQIATDLNISDRVQFLGLVPHDRMAALLRESDALLFTSLRDSTGAIVLEAMCKGLPVIAVNHQGMRTMLPDDAAIKIPVTTPTETVAAFASAMDRLAASAELRREMAQAGLRCARENTWEERTKQITEFYESAIADLSEFVPV